MEERISSNQVFRGRILSVRVDQVRTPSGKKTSREVVERPDTVSVLALDESQNVLFVRQFRYVLGRDTLEIPAGTIDAGETREQAARRELREETGYDCHTLSLICEYYPAVGYSTEKMSVFLARELSRAPLDGDEERILLHKMSFDQAYRSALSGLDTFEDAKTRIALLVAHAKHLI